MKKLGLFILLLVPFANSFGKEYFVQNPLKWQEDHFRLQEKHQAMKSEPKGSPTIAKELQDIKARLEVFHRPKRPNETITNVYNAYKQAYSDLLALEKRATNNPSISQSLKNEIQNEIKIVFGRLNGFQEKQQHGPSPSTSKSEPRLPGAKYSGKFGGYGGPQGGAHNKAPIIPVTVINPPKNGLGSVDSRSLKFSKELGGLYLPVNGKNYPCIYQVTDLDYVDENGVVHAAPSYYLCAKDKKTLYENASAQPE